MFNFRLYITKTLTTWSLTGAPGTGRYAASVHSASCLPSATARHHQCVCDLENLPAKDPKIAAPDDEETPHST
ncbi:hypothetical protein J6590_077333 [Homalodisca vitripennis]|nr:hypothetical protein J6590_077333 [Homalodisca vitripennis]